MRKRKKAAPNARGREVDLYMKKRKYYLTLTLAERRLAIIALLHFRNKIVRQGIDPMDVDGMLGRLV